MSMLEHDGEGHVVARWARPTSPRSAEIWQRFCDAEFTADWESTKQSTATTHVSP